MAASVSLSPSERSQRARIAAYAQKSKHDPKETTRQARQAFRAQFYDGIPRIFRCLHRTVCRSVSLRATYPC